MASNKKKKVRTPPSKTEEQITRSHHKALCRAVAKWHADDAIVFFDSNRQRQTGYVDHTLGEFIQVRHPRGMEWTVNIRDVIGRTDAVSWPGLYDNLRQSWITNQLSNQYEQFTANCIDNLQALYPAASKEQKAAIDVLLPSLQAFLDDPQEPLDMVDEPDRVFTGFVREPEETYEDGESDTSVRSGLQEQEEVT